MEKGKTKKQMVAMLVVVAMLLTGFVAIVGNGGALAEVVGVPEKAVDKTDSIGAVNNEMIYKPKFSASDYKSFELSARGIGEGTYSTFYDFDNFNMSFKDYSGESEFARFCLYDIYAISSQATRMYYDAEQNISVINNVSATVVDNLTVRYAGVYDNVSLDYFVTPYYAEENYVLSATPTVTDRQDVCFESTIKYNLLSMYANEQTYSIGDAFETSGTIEFKTTSNETVYQYAEAVAYYTNGTGVDKTINGKYVLKMIGSDYRIAKVFNLTSINDAFADGATTVTVEPMVVDFVKYNTHGGVLFNAGDDRVYSLYIRKNDAGKMALFIVGYGFTPTYTEDFTTLQSETQLIEFASQEVYICAGSDGVLYLPEEDSVILGYRNYAGYMTGDLVKIKLSDLSITETRIGYKGGHHVYGIGLVRSETDLNQICVALTYSGRVVEYQFINTNLVSVGDRKTVSWTSGGYLCLDIDTDSVGNYYLLVWSEGTACKTYKIDATGVLVGTPLNLVSGAYIYGHNMAVASGNIYVFSDKDWYGYPDYANPENGKVLIRKYSLDLVKDTVFGDQIYDPVATHENGNPISPQAVTGNLRFEASSHMIDKDGNIRFAVEVMDKGMDIPHWSPMFYGKFDITAGEFVHTSRVPDATTHNNYVYGFVTDYCGWNHIMYYTYPSSTLYWYYDTYDSVARTIQEPTGASADTSMITLEKYVAGEFEPMSPDEIIKSVSVSGIDTIVADPEAGVFMGEAKISGVDKMMGLEQEGVVKSMIYDIRPAENLVMNDVGDLRLCFVIAETDITRSVGAFAPMYDSQIFRDRTMTQADYQYYRDTMELKALYTQAEPIVEPANKKLEARLTPDKVILGEEHIGEKFVRTVKWDDWNGVDHLANVEGEVIYENYDMINKPSYEGGGMALFRRAGAIVIPNVDLPTTLKTTGDAFSLSVEIYPQREYSAGIGGRPIPILGRETIVDYMGDDMKGFAFGLNYDRRQFWLKTGDGIVVTEYTKNLAEDAEAQKILERESALLQVSYDPFLGVRASLVYSEKASHPAKEVQLVEEVATIEMPSRDLAFGAKRCSAITEGFYGYMGRISLEDKYRGAVLDAEGKLNVNYRLRGQWAGLGKSISAGEEPSTYNVVSAISKNVLFHSCGKYLWTGNSKPAIALVDELGAEMTTMEKQSFEAFKFDTDVAVGGVQVVLEDLDTEIRDEDVMWEAGTLLGRWGESKLILDEDMQLSVDSLTATWYGKEARELVFKKSSGDEGVPINVMVKDCSVEDFYETEMYAMDKREMIAHVLNRAPTSVPNLYMAGTMQTGGYVDTTVTLEVDGRKWNTVTLDLWKYDFSQHLQTITITRQAGDPDMQSQTIVLQMDTTDMYRGRISWTPFTDEDLIQQYGSKYQKQIVGANPVKLKLTQNDKEEQINYVFNHLVKHAEDKWFNLLAVHAGETILLDGQESYDLDGKDQGYSMYYEWSVNDVVISQDALALWTPQVSGQLLVKLKVTDDEISWNLAEKALQIGEQGAITRGYMDALYSLKANITLFNATEENITVLEDVTVGDVFIQKNSTNATIRLYLNIVNTTGLNETGIQLGLADIWIEYGTKTFGGINQTVYCDGIKSFWVDIQVTDIADGEAKFRVYSGVNLTEKEFTVLYSQTFDYVYVGEDYDAVWVLSSGSYNYTISVNEADYKIIVNLGDTVLNGNISVDITDVKTFEHKVCFPFTDYVLWTTKKITVEIAGVGSTDAKMSCYIDSMGYGTFWKPIRLSGQHWFKKDTTQALETGDIWKVETDDKSLTASFGWF